MASALRTTGLWLLLLLAVLQPREAGGFHNRHKRLAARSTAEIQAALRQRRADFEAARRAVATLKVLPVASQLADRLREADCRSFACLREAHAAAAGRSDARFNFPHFIIAGWQKTATTALYRHLEKHTHVQPPTNKEPHLFTQTCNASWCDPSAQDIYFDKLGFEPVVESGMQLAAFEASADYAKMGALAAPLIRRELPWVRVVLCLREPISHALSLLNHHMQEPWVFALAKGDPCLKKHDVYTCLRRHFTEETPNRAFAPALSAWIAAFPQEQLHIVQYENLTRADSQIGVLADLKRFLGLEPALPQVTLAKQNVRRKQGGWPIKRSQYEALVELVRPDAERVGELLEGAGLGGGRAWLREWEEVWGRQLAGCPQGRDPQTQEEPTCRIKVS